MQHNFGDFLRHGGTGQYSVFQRGDQIYGFNTAVSIKSTFPKYAALRADFSDRLDFSIFENTRMLLNALVSADSVPFVKEGDLLDVSDVRDEALTQWDTRVEGIFNDYHTHPLRLRPLRTAMEERLLRAFAGVINQLRQADLGIEKYVWRSKDDTKVRDAHAEHDDKVFRWDTPPEGGHPGHAHNCRCYAEPIKGDIQSFTRIEYEPTDGGFPLQNLLEHEERGGHTIARHVGKSKDYLWRAVSIDQDPGWLISRYRRRHGSFASVHSAQRLTNSNLSQNADVVSAVSTGRLTEAFITSDFAFVTGIEAYRIGPRASAPIVIRQTTGVGTKIQHAPDMPNGFIIVTSYPRSE